MTFNTVTLAGTYKKPDGTAESGTVRIAPSTSPLVDAGGGVILAGTLSVPLTNGSFSVVLPATDDSRLNPTGFGYTVIADLQGSTVGPVSFSLPASPATVDMAAVTTVDPSTFAPGATYMPTATAQSTFAQAADRRLVSVPVASRVSVATSGLNTAGPTQATSRIKHRLNVETGTVQLAYGNTYNNTGVETDGPNSVTVKATVEFAIGSGPTYYFVPVRFSGARTVVIPPGGVVWSDPIALDHAAGDYFYTRTNVVVGSGTERWPVGWATQTADGEGVETGVDKADSGTVTANNTFCYGPLSIRGRATSTLLKALGGIGDSIMSGNGDGNTKGWWYRKFSGVVPEQRIAYPSEQGLSFTLPTRRQPRMQLIDGCTSIICGYGINDVKSGNAAVQVKRDMITCWRYAARRGAKAYQHTLTPVTTSTDAWVTTVNQTVTANEANRVAVNDWLRDGAPFTNNDFEPAAIGASGGLIVRIGAAGHPLTGLLEFADVVETARNSGIWKASNTGDGTHPNATAHQALADSFTLAAIGMA